MITTRSLAYSTPPGTADITVNTLATPDRHYASIETMIAALNASGLTAVFEDFRGGDAFDEKPIRMHLAAALVGSVGQTAEESLHLVTPCALDNKPGIEVEKFGLATYTATAVSIPSAVGGRTAHVHSTVAFAGDGVIEKRTGKTPDVSGGKLTILDVGAVSGILRIMRRISATAVSPMNQKWR